MWTSLEAVHESRGYGYAIALKQSLFRACAEEGDNIIEHLNKLKEIWEKLNMLNNKNFNVPDMQFKTIIASSLPASWDIFTDPYVGASPRAIGEINSKESILSQEFIGILKEEYLH